MKQVLTIILIISMIVTASIAWGKTIYVDDDNTEGPWDGTKEHPYQYIQDGINAAVNGDTVLVADGIYKGIGNKNLSFKGKNIIVTSVNGAESTIIDCENNGRGFHLSGGQDSSAVISGFTIINGAVDTYGGGIYCDGSFPTISSIRKKYECQPNN